MPSRNSKTDSFANSRAEFRNKIKMNEEQFIDAKPPFT
jgi:hypothetical protein